MKSESSRVTSFARLLVDTDGTDAIRHIEIPLFQRDYAQGRDDLSTSKIRSAFLDVLHSAITCDEHKEAGLDFVYGDVDARDGALRPLDGQQRLTTLFLLHWYVAHRNSIDLTHESWTAFTYATRSSARLFCERIVKWAPPANCEDPTAWIRDQPWFQYVWRHDPTIQAMLRMISSIHERFADEDLSRAWQRLTNAESPAVSFHLLPIHGMGSPEDLYIKMNSRGKPLTEFENFKARLESDIAPIDPESEVAHKIDGSWADVFWPYRGDDDLVDDKLLRYMRFLIENCEWKGGTVDHEDTAEARARELFTTKSSIAREHLKYVIQAFDTWAENDPGAYFSALFRPAREEATETDRVPLFVADGKINLFESCVNSYGRARGLTRVYTFGQQLLLAAVLIYRSDRTREVDYRLKRRIRIIRNLIEASENEIRLERMPEILAEVEDIILNGLQRESKTSFNRAQFNDELVKAKFIDAHPELESKVFQLEDNGLLRGALVAFELDPELLTLRTEAFNKAFGSKEHWTMITGALLAAGPYARARNRTGRSYQFGVGSDGTEAPWRSVLASGSRDDLASTRAALMEILDSITAYGGVKAGLDAVRTQALANYKERSEFDWRYYLVKYDSMREGRSGIYFGSDGSLGYSLCMLDKTQLNSNYRDPYLLAIRRESDVGSERVNDPWFTGHEWNERWLRLSRSGAGIRCVPEGLVVAPPTDENHTAAFRQVCADYDLQEQTLLIPKADRGGTLDSIDRVQAGANLLRAFVAAGL